MRNSSIELLRIISMLMIISMHVLGVHYMEPTKLVDREFVLFINSFCNAGVTIFVLISGYYGIRFKMERLMYMANQTWFYSLLLFGVGFLLFHRFLRVDLIKTIFPIVTNKYWFITSYIILFVASPYLNACLDNMTKKTYTAFLAFLLVVFVVAPTFLKFEITCDGGKGPINMFVAYMTGYYFKRFDFPAVIKKYAVVILILSFLVVFGVSSWQSYGNPCMSRGLFRDNSLFILLIAISLFYLFSKMSFYSPMINGIAKLTLGVYLVQETLKHWIPNFTNNIFLYWAVSLFGLYLASLLVEFLRVRLLDGLFKRISLWECKMLGKVLKLDDDLK